MRFFAMRCAFFGARLCMVILGGCAQQAPVRVEPGHSSRTINHEATKDLGERKSEHDDLIGIHGERIPGVPKDEVTVELNGVTLR